MGFRLDRKLRSGVALRSYDRGEGTCVAGESHGDLACSRLALSAAKAQEGARGVPQ